MSTLENMLTFVTDEIKPDLMFWTGDNTAHNVWDNTADETALYTITVTNMIQMAFKDSNITVLPIHGNHDTWVEEFQDFDEPYTNYEINHFKKYWTEWLDDAALEKFGEYGYYSMDIKLQKESTMPPARLIALNTQACNSMNTYIFAERQDPGGMFAWLEEELANAE